jgi:hypothetical protein
MRLISFVKTAMNKRLRISESHDDLNRCTPCSGKSDQHATHFTRSVRVWPSTICIPRDPHIATFHELSTDLDGSHCSRETGIPDYIPSMPADRSVGPHPVSLPSQPVKQ